MTKLRSIWMGVVLLAGGGWSAASFAAFQVDAYDLPGVHINTMAEADRAIASGRQVNSSTVDTINFTNHRRLRGRFDGDNAFPAVPNRNNFALHVTTTVTVPTSGVYTFGTNADDGLRLEIDGMTVIYDDSNHLPQDRFGTVNLSAGTHSLEMVFWQQRGVAALELFVASGSFGSFNDQFELLSATSSGVNVGGNTGTVPVPGAPLLLGAGILAFWASRRRKTAVVEPEALPA